MEEENINEIIVEGGNTETVSEIAVESIMLPSSGNSDVETENIGDFVKEDTAETVVVPAVDEHVVDVVTPVADEPVVDVVTPVVDEPVCEINSESADIVSENIVKISETSSESKVIVESVTTNDINEETIPATECVKDSANLSISQIASALENLKTESVEKIRSTSKEILQTGGSWSAALATSALNMTSSLTGAAKSISIPYGKSKSTTLQSMLQEQEYNHLKQSPGVNEIAINARSQYVWAPITVPSGSSIVWKVMVKEHDIQFGIRERIMEDGGSNEIDLADNVEFGEHHCTKEDSMQFEHSGDHMSGVKVGDTVKSTVHVGRNSTRRLEAGKEYWGKFLNNGFDSGRHVVFVFDNCYSIFTSKTCLFQVLRNEEESPSLGVRGQESSSSLPEDSGMIDVHDAEVIRSDVTHL